ncbi:TPA: class I SAM-dependent methyltransferase [Bacillus cereus]|uniref:Methyltransferase n=1 Tax=Bacillus cereus TaxID=1396 RepID=A0A2A9A3D5_BACCE|nr:MULTISPECIES: class I SAM-dependent methyltransferase [Bacillus]MCP1180675.1 class I SAM-dependent methyltransferase [Bacillus sp. 1663tsa1]MCP1284336.1 class I SAM-dependent methyltransferase [Bacillus sp. S0635]MCQ6349367.1 class I SAM-dependent methyltransferase [Bacillus cereus]MCU5462277.1 class I SAM-dependent methyltransferase [Bacillus cereus]MCU5750757.1 class I SAM-dependent methyltransferase [Bacillus cereus]
MDTLDSLLFQLEQYGEEHDRNKKTREEKLRNISREMGKFLSILVKGCSAKNILEIGTSNGYSTLWLANAVEETNGNVTTVELSSERVGEALVNFEKANLLQRIDVHNQEAGAFLDSQLNHSFDFIFLDSERTQYMWWLEHIKRILQPNGFLVVDNATSHASELAEFRKMIEEDEIFETVLLAFQNGAFVARKKK